MIFVGTFVGTRRFLMILRKVTIVLRNKKIPDNHCLSGYPTSVIVVEATGLEPTASAPTVCPQSP